MRIIEELLTSAEGQFAFGVIGLTVVIGVVMLYLGWRKSRGQG